MCQRFQIIPLHPSLFLGQDTPSSLSLHASISPMGGYKAVPEGAQERPALPTVTASGPLRMPPSRAPAATGSAASPMAHVTPDAYVITAAG